jgi:hypothetical protein
MHFHITNSSFSIKFGRGLIYDRETCDLLAYGVGSEVYRLNLEQGQFLSPLETGLDGKMSIVSLLGLRH